MVSGSYFAIGTGSAAGGVVDITNASGLGSATVTVNSGGALQLGHTGTPSYSTNPLVLNSMGVSNDGGLRVISAGRHRNLHGAISLTAPHESTTTPPTCSRFPPALSRRGPLTVGGVGNTTISKAIATTSTTSGLNKDGTGTLTLSGTNTYTGTTNVTNGILEANAPAALPITAPRVTLHVTGPGTVAVLGSGWTSAQIGNLANNTTFTSGGAAGDQRHGRQC